MSAQIVEHRKLYRLPWNLADNGISWLEPTSVCNMACDGCYRQDTAGHKSWEEVCHDLDVFERLRKSDAISIAGGDPLVYPQIVELVREVRRRGFKPILNTNGQALSPELLRELKDAGVFGITIHVDSNQGRGGKWHNANELELNELRLQYARMIASVGGVACAFNATVYDENVRYLPGMVKWAQEHIDIVHTMVFICFRHVIPDMPFDWYAGGKKVDWQSLWYHSDSKRRIDIKSTDLVKLMRETEPEFAPSAYINGTEEPDSLKWLLTVRLGNTQTILGYIGPKVVELSMAAYHFVNDRYLSYGTPKSMTRGRSAAWLLWPLDAGMRKITARYLGYLSRNPFRLFKKLHFQSIMFIQPVDCLPDGRQNMCDSCPDLTVFEDRLVYSCRLEEMKRFGTFLQTVRRGESIAG
ncbi:MAG: radical SAM protein [candidate division Zixibacteria bacterium]|nr:radical SAM protein [candidate division Zixibacteria bacterium]